MKRFFAIALFGMMTAPLFAADGATIFKANGCTSCHGEDGTKVPEKGKRPLNSPEIKAKSDTELANSIAKGNPKLSSEDVKAIVAYVRSLV